MIEFRGEYIEIEVQYTVLTDYAVHILIYLVLVLDADHGSDEATLESWHDIVPNIAGEIGKIPGILLILDGFREVEMVFVVPEI
jgi:hypothetical protein